MTPMQAIDGTVEVISAGCLVWFGGRRGYDGGNIMGDARLTRLIADKLSNLLVYPISFHYNDDPGYN